VPSPYSIKYKVPHFSKLHHFGPAQKEIYKVYFSGTSGSTQLLYKNHQAKSSSL
jgi:hypothetical protein